MKSHDQIVKDAKINYSCLRILVGLLMNRKLYRFNGKQEHLFYLHHPCGSSEFIPLVYIQCLLTKNYIRQSNVKPNHFNLTKKGFEIAMEKIDQIGGKVYSKKDYPMIKNKTLENVYCD